NPVTARSGAAALSTAAPAAYTQLTSPVPAEETEKKPAPGPACTPEDVYLFREGTHARLYQCLGAHVVAVKENTAGTRFAVWAPNAGRVSVIGDFNGWRGDAHPLAARSDHSGIWEGFVEGVGPGALYKYRIRS